VNPIVKVDAACGAPGAGPTGLFKLGTAGEKLIVSGTGLGVVVGVAVGVSVGVSVGVAVALDVGVAVTEGVGVSVGVGVRVDVGAGAGESPWLEDDESHPVAITAARARTAQPTRNRAGVHSCRATPPNFTRVESIIESPSTTSNLN